MAAISYLIVGPSLILSLIGLMRKPAHDITSAANWQQASVDVIIPAFNAQNDIALCLASLAKQTLKPRKITLFDDGSHDNTSQYAKEICASLGLQIDIIRREKSVGKTTSVRTGAFETEADFEFILDSDTILTSPNYIEKLISALCTDEDIASACGMVLPLTESERDRLIHDATVGPLLQEHLQKHPEISYRNVTSRFKRLLRGITNSYREVLYKFLEKVVYRGQQSLAKSLINPIGCAVAYRKKHLRKVFEYADATIGQNLTTSEDIYIGFALNMQGQRNIQVKEVCAHTVEPLVTRLHKQVFLWSSAFFQSIYFNFGLFTTPFKYIKSRANNNVAGREYTKKFGRPIGWYIFFAALEKVFFPIAVVAMFALCMWEAIAFTFVLETLILAVFLFFMCENERFKMFGKTILVTPVRYMVLLTDLYIFLWFMYEISTGQDKEWKK